MTPEQIKIASDRVKELTDYIRKSEAILKFTDSLEQHGYLDLKTSYQEELALPSGEIYKLIGAEVVALLRTKIYERAAYLFQLEAVDLLESNENLDQTKENAE